MAQASDHERIALLEQAVTLVGGKASLGRALGYRDGAFVGQMLRGERPITEKTLGLMRSIHALGPLFSGQQATGAPPPSDPPSITQALEVLGIELARDMPTEVREDVADALAKLAHRKGQDREQSEVLRLLQQAEPGKRNGTR